MTAVVPAGYGFEVLRFEDESLREIAKLPADVRIIAALPPLQSQDWHAPQGWHHEVQLRAVYILICHRYCVRVARGDVYMVNDLEDFLSRYRRLDADEREPLPTPDPDYQMAREAWHRDADGKVREYVWHATGGWVPR